MDDCRYVDELSEVFSAAQPDTVYVSHGVNTDSNATSTPASFEGLQVLISALAFQCAYCKCSSCSLLQCVYMMRKKYLHMQNGL